MSWYYAYNTKKKAVLAYEIEEMQRLFCDVYIEYKLKDGHVKHAFSHREPGLPYIQASQPLSTWLEERDDSKALDILREPRLEQIRKRSEEAAKRLANLQHERDIWESHDVEVIG